MEQLDATTDRPSVAPSAPPRWRRLAGPVGTLLALGTATALIAVIDPHTPGTYPVCPTQALFGIDCPGCGGLRATHDLAQGDVLGAAGHNLLFVLSVPIILVVLARSLWLAWHGRVPQQMAATRARVLVILAVVVVILFSVIRNLPGVEFLASG